MEDEVAEIIEARTRRSLPMTDAPDPGRLDLIAVLQELAEYRLALQIIQGMIGDEAGDRGTLHDISRVAEDVLAKYEKKP